MRILVTGANGQVGHALLRALAGRSVLGNADATRASCHGHSGAGWRPEPGIGMDGRENRFRVRSFGAPRNDEDAVQATAASMWQACGTRAPRNDETPAPDTAPAREIIPATHSGKLEDGTPCECIDLADLDGLRESLDRIAPGLVINAAAYTAVDRAEDEPELAQRINADAVGMLGAWANRHGARVVHYSTDYVFDGAGTRPYRETDATHPLGAYGYSKLAGEIALRDSGARHLILRTAWVYAARGKNFLLTMLRLAAERDGLRVVDDQLGAPTSARVIADVTAQAVAQWCTPVSSGNVVPGNGGEALARDGVYHLVASGQTSWCGFARAIFERAQRAGLIERAPVVHAITTADYPTRATRPVYSVLDTGKLRGTFDIALPDWQTALDGVIDELVAHLRRPDQAAAGGGSGTERDPPCRNPGV